jgi:hypothetical protein
MRLFSWFRLTAFIAVVIILVEGERPGKEALVVLEGAFDLRVTECLQPREAAEAFAAAG